MNEIFVTNKNDFHHSDEYDGVALEFPQNERVLIPLAAARHCFGFGLKDKTENLVRLGWANIGGDEGVRRLARFIFTQPVMVEQPIDDAAPIVEEEPPAATASAG